MSIATNVFCEFRRDMTSLDLFWCCVLWSVCHYFKLLVYKMQYIWPADNLSDVILLNKAQV